jgi:hypothetical protein
MQKIEKHVKFFYTFIINLILRTMKKLMFTLAILYAVSFELYCQKDKFEDMMTDVDAEESGQFTLRFLNAEKGTPVEGADVNITKIGDLKTDAEGRVLFNIVEDGLYQFTFAKQGFIGANFTFEVIAGTIFSNRFSVSPLIELGAIRIVLEWGSKPRDLDAHLVKNGAYHISYREKAVADDHSARLDLDDRDGYGPETITIRNTDSRGSYTYYVQDYSNQNESDSKQIGKSKAIVRIYSNSGLLNEFHVNKALRGDRWDVFTIQNGKIQ